MLINDILQYQQYSDYNILQYQRYSDYSILQYQRYSDQQSLINLIYKILHEYFKKVNVVLSKCLYMWYIDLLV